MPSRTRVRVGGRLRPQARLPSRTGGPASSRDFLRGRAPPRGIFRAFSEELYEQHRQQDAHHVGHGRLHVQVAFAGGTLVHRHLHLAHARVRAADEVGQGVGLWPHVDAGSQKLHRAAVEAAHARGRVLDGAAGGELDGERYEAAAGHAQRAGLLAVHETRADDDVVVGDGLDQRGHVFRPVLLVRVELNGAVVAVTAGIQHAGLERARQPQVHREVDDVEAVFPADGQRRIRGAVVDDHVVEAFFANALDHLCYGRLLVVGRHDEQRAALLHDTSPFCCAVSPLSMTSYRITERVAIKAKGSNGLQERQEGGATSFRGEGGEPPVGGRQAGFPAARQDSRDQGGLGNRDGDPRLTGWPGSSPRASLSGGLPLPRPCRARTAP